MSTENTKKDSENVTKERRALPEEDVEAFFPEDKRSEGTSSTAAAVPLPQGEDLGDGQSRTPVPTGDSGKAAAKKAPKAKKESTYHQKRAEHWKTVAKNLQSETYLRGLLSDKAYQMKDLKIGRFRNATEAQVEIFRSISAFTEA